MDELIQDKLKYIAEDELLLRAIKHIFDKNIEEEKPDVERTDSDEIVGQKYRAYENAKRILTETFKDIQSFKSQKVETKKLDKSK